ncbi:MAG TPA: ATP-binding protein [Methanobacterium sp.]|nr:ATP-binding protein [Methanobacterium sp.]
MDYIVDASIRMKEMIHDLLEYSRISTTQEEFKPLNLNELVENVLNDLKLTIRENNAEITHEKLPMVLGDYDKISRVFLNFITNAIKFKKDNESPKIHISAVNDEKSDEYVISITDNGIGMDEEYLDRIFVIFQRLHTREKYEGSGIGLAITKKIIEMHGGKVWVKSEPGVGTTFFFTLQRLRS